MTSHCLLIKALQSYVSLREPEPTAPHSLIPASSAPLGKSSSEGKGWSSSIIHRQDQKRPFHFRSVSQLQWRHTSVSAHLASSIPGDTPTSEQLLPVTSGDMRTRAEANSRQTRALLCRPTGEYVQCSHSSVSQIQEQQDNSRGFLP